MLICESLIDAFSFCCAGFRNVTASYGTGGFTDDHRRAFAHRRVQRCLIAYDHDQAGDAAAEKLAVELSAAGVEYLRVIFPGGADANDVAVGSDDLHRDLGQLLAKARWISGPPAISQHSRRPLTARPARASNQRPSPALTACWQQLAGTFPGPA